MTAFYGSIALTLLVLTLIGMYLAKISEKNMIIYGIQMLFVGVITAGLRIATSVLLGRNDPI